MSWKKLVKESRSVLDQSEVENELDYVSQLFMDLTGYIDFTWTWAEDGRSVTLKPARTWDNPLDDDMWEVGCLVSRLTGWEVDTNDNDEDSMEPKDIEIVLVKP